MDWRAGTVRPNETPLNVATTGRKRLGSWAKIGKELTKGRGIEPPPTRTTSSCRSRLRPANGMPTDERSGDRAPSYTHHEFL